MTMQRTMKLYRLPEASGARGGGAGSPALGGNAARLWGEGVRK